MNWPFKVVKNDRGAPVYSGKCFTSYASDAYHMTQEQQLCILLFQCLCRFVFQPAAAAFAGFACSCFSLSNQPVIRSRVSLIVMTIKGHAHAHAHAHALRKSLSVKITGNLCLVGCCSAQHIHPAVHWCQLIGVDSCLMTFGESFWLCAVQSLGVQTTVAPEQVAQLLLGKMKDVAEAFFGGPLDGAVITVPAYFSDAQRQATKNAARTAKIKVCCQAGLNPRPRF